MTVYAAVTRIPAALAAFLPATLDSQHAVWIEGSVSERCSDNSVVTSFTLASSSTLPASLQGFHAKVQQRKASFAAHSCLLRRLFSPRCDWYIPPESGLRGFCRGKTAIFSATAVKEVLDSAIKTYCRNTADTKVLFRQSLHKLIEPYIYCIAVLQVLPSRVGPTKPESANARPCQYEIQWLADTPSALCQSGPSRRSTCLQWQVRERVYQSNSKLYSMK